MRNGKVFRAAAWTLVLGLTVLAGATAARAETGDERKVEKRRVVVVDKDGKQQVFEGDGLLMKRGYMGVNLTELTPELRTHFGAPEEAGVMVSKVEPGSPAEKAGIKAGDVITSINGSRVGSREDLLRGMRDAATEDVQIGIVRDRKESSVTAKIEKLRRTGGGRPV